MTELPPRSWTNFKFHDALQSLQAAGLKELPIDFDTSLVDSKWRPLLEVPDRAAALRAFEGRAFLRIRKGLLGG